MFRKLFLSFCLFVWVAAPLLAQNSLPTRSQLENQRDLLQAYSARLMELNDRYQVGQKILDLASQDQLDAIKALRISPSQAMELVKLVQQSMPAGPLDDQAMKNLQKTLQPQMEKLLGSDQFDLILQLFPTPQQKAKAEAIMAEVANTPEGQAAYKASQDLSAALTADQRSFLQPFLDLAQAPAAGATSDLTPAEPAPGADQRNLVTLRRTGAGDFFADIVPDQNYLAHLPRTYRVQGGDPNIMAAVATSSGIPVRLLGRYDGDVLRVAATKLLGPPAFLAIGGGGTVWHGKLPAKVVTLNPAVIEMDAGAGQKVQATLDASSTDSKQFQQAAAGSGVFLVEGTFVSDASGSTLYDAQFSPWQPPQQSVPAACLLQASEEFFDHAAEEFLNGHKDKLSYGGQNDLIKFRVTDLGMTLHGCQASQARVFGMAVLSHSGLDIASVQFELTGQVALSGTNVTLAPVPGTMALRLNYPGYLQAPDSWTADLEKIMGQEYTRGFSFALPADYQEKLTSTGLVTDAQINGVKLWTLPTEDRRTALVACTMPADAGSAGPPLNVLQSRIVNPGEIAVSVPEQTINDTIKKKVPGMLPILQDIPENMQEQQGGVKFKQLEIAELDVNFQGGVFKINNCVLNVHWRYGIFAGVEPGIKFSGVATLVGKGEPTQVFGKLTIDKVEFLSPHVLAMTPQEQADIKTKLLKAVADYDLPLGVDQKLLIPQISDQAALVPTGAGGTATPSELLLQGRMSP